jgi:putative acetyltransferase
MFYGIWIYTLIALFTLLIMIIRKGNLSDLVEIQELFVDTIKDICKQDYNSQQIKAWCSAAENNQRWIEILTIQFFIVAQDNEKIVGFCSLDQHNYIDLLYTHKDYQRQGIAHKLYSKIENEARLQKQTKLTSDVSLTARGFFECIGFKVINEQIVVRQGIELTNFKMTKDLVD